MLNIVLWKWEQPGFKFTYLPDYVNIMCAMLRRNMHGFPHRIICVTDRESGVTECETAPLWQDLWDLPNGSGAHLPSCYRRLKLYDPATQKDLGIDKGDRILSLDVDTVIAADIRQLVQTEGRYVGWELKGRSHPRVFNGSFQMFTAGDLSEIWQDFDPRTSPSLAAREGFLGSDQAWLSYKLVKREGSVGLKWPEVSSYPLQNRVQSILRRDNRIIFFHGSQKPWMETTVRETPWVERYWRQ